MGTTAEKLQKSLANKQSLVDIVNSKAGTSYTINSKPSDIVETINAQWGEGGGIDGVSFDGQTLSVDTDPLHIGTIQITGQGANIDFTGIPEVYFTASGQSGYPSKIYIDGKQLTPDMIAEGVTLFGITGTYKGNSSSATVEGNTLVVSGTVEDNTLTLSSGSVENNTLKL